MSQLYIFTGNVISLKNITDIERCPTSEILFHKDSILYFYQHDLIQVGLFDKESDHGDREKLQSLPHVISLLYANDNVIIYLTTTKQIKCIYRGAPGSEFEVILPSDAAPFQQCVRIKTGDTYILDQAGRVYCVVLPNNFEQVDSTVSLRARPLHELSRRFVLALACGENHVLALAKSEAYPTQDTLETCSGPSVMAGKNSTPAVDQRNSPKILSDLNAIELQEMPMANQGLAVTVPAPPGRFSFVSTVALGPPEADQSASGEVKSNQSDHSNGVTAMQNAATATGSLDGNGIWPNFSSHSVAQFVRERSISELRSPMATEVYAWGSNAHGELGLGDKEDRSEPTLVECLSDKFVIKVVAGRLHSVALTAAGEVFVTGSNCTGQIKQTADVKVQSVPVKCRLGSNVNAIDVAAGEDFTVLLVNGLNFVPDVYYIGRDYAKSSNTDGVAVRLGHLSKEGIVHCINAGPVGQACAVHIRDMNDVALRFAFELCLKELAFVQKVKEIKDFMVELQSRTKEQLTVDANEVFVTLCVQLGEFLSFHILSFATFRSHLLGASSAEGAKVFVEMFLATFTKKTYFQKVELLLQAYVNVLLMSALKDLTLTGNNIDHCLQWFHQLCVDNRVEATKPHRAVRVLLQVPFSQPQVFVEWTERYKEHSDVDWSVACNQWRALDEFCKRRIELAESTYQFWSKNSSLSPTFRKPNRLLICDLHKSVDLSALYLDGYSQNFQRVFLFSNSLMVIQKPNNYTQFPINLLWPTQIGAAGEKNDKPMIRILTPENELKLQFSDQVKQSNFLHHVVRAIHDGCVSMSRDLSDSANFKTPRKLTVVSLGPEKRHAAYTFSSKHSLYAEANYEGSWKNAKPHGSGWLHWKDNKQYKGKFHDGLLHGFGELRVPAGVSFDHTKGYWINGTLNGLTLISYANGDRYEGFVTDGKRHGHGVFVQGLSTYVGQWAHDTRCGYGVLDSGPREKYLGMWLNSLYHGCGVLVTVDGIYYEGTFERGKLTKGVMVCPDGFRYEGDFDGIGLCYGKGVMYYENGDSISGNFYGGVYDQVKITGTLTKCLQSPRILKPFDIERPNSPSRLLSTNCSVLSADQKWMDIFEHFYAELGLKGDQSGLPAVDVEPAKVWEGVAAASERLKHRPDFQCLKKTISEHTQKIPDFKQAQSYQYLELIRHYWTEAACSCHPFNQLISGLSDVFSVSYAGVSAHALLVPHAVQELRSLVYRIFAVLRLLFPNLPTLRDLDMPQNLESIGQKTGTERFKAVTVPESPSQMICDTLIARVYPTVFTLYVMQTAKFDHDYTYHSTIINSKGERELLTFLEVNERFWPSNATRDAAIVVDYSDAIMCLQQLSSEFSPSAKLKLVIRTFQIINECLEKTSPQRHWDMDDFCPIFMYVVVKAHVEHLGAEIQLVEDFIPYLHNLGEVEMMFTTLKACYYQLVQDKRCY